MTLPASGVWFRYGHGTARRRFVALAEPGPVFVALGLVDLFLFLLEHVRGLVGAGRAVVFFAPFH